MKAESAGAKGDVLAVDDLQGNLDLLRTILKPFGYGVRAFNDGPSALAAARAEPPDVILLDIMMPEMDGYEVCARLKADPLTAAIPVLFISANEELAGKLRAFKAGGVDYITKPFHPAEVLARVNTHITLHRLKSQLEHQNQHLRALVEAQVRDIVQAKEEVSRAQLATIVALSKLAESRDHNTGRHIERVAAGCRVLAEGLRRRSVYSQILDTSFVEMVVQASPLHDIGKVGIADSVLLKPGRLTPDEYVEMQRHTTIGVETLATVLERYPDSDFLRAGSAIAGSHHEWWNGQGYPDGLSGSQIPVAAHIVSLADAYDALRSERCYKPALPHTEAREMLLAAGGTHFDPTLIEVFLEVEEELQDVQRQLSE